ncbi:hypothetical protein [Virgisporangium aurantiacum]|uniref:Mercuric ion transport protein n=1 Tax=Virgisporangium aurantiacum TaxID=175570 RepID=A0A8J4E923_9ACTN|nr:hypothetical protein [Virgisporangium aurantiacum]GIJ63327.1 hypothetical protein Vau01_108430 [Virgisporangium aurantiacum]
MTVTETTAHTRGSRLRRRIVKAVAGVFGTAGVGFVCCVLPVLLAGGGTAAVADGLARETRAMIPVGILLLLAAVAFIAVRRHQAARRRRPDGV